MNSKLHLYDLAGYCPEEAVWKMMADVCDYLSKDSSGIMICPETVAVYGDIFMLEDGHEKNEDYLAPEQQEGSWTQQQVWQLGAMAFYMATGHIPFGGHGGKYQREHPHVVLPVLPKAFRSLTPIVQRCLQANPSKRISLAELGGVVRKGLADCSNQQRGKTEQPDISVRTEKHENEKWPEEMIEI